MTTNTKNSFTRFAAAAKDCFYVNSFRADLVQCDRALKMDGEINKHREPEANWVLKGATVSCTRSGKYFVSLLYEFEKDIQPIKPTKETSLGLDYFKEQFKAVYHMSVEEAWAKFGTE